MARKFLAQESAGSVVDVGPIPRAGSERKRDRAIRKPRISLVAAISRNRIIGFSNRLPWHLPEDLRHFRRLTLNHTILMGRKTYESIGSALPKRRNIVISRRAEFSAAGVEVVSSLETALAKCRANSRVYVIGGGEIFRETLPMADRIHLTVVYLEEHQRSLFGPFLGDRFFPTISPQEWKIKHLGERWRAQNVLSDSKRASHYGYLNSVFYRFIDLVRVQPASSAVPKEDHENFDWSNFSLVAPRERAFPRK